MKDSLGDRIKGQYEDRTRYLLPRRTYTMIRVDGKAFHSFTKEFKRPFDKGLMTLMDSTAKAMCEEIQGAVLAYVQSDEISILLTDFAKPTTSAWFDGNVQKMASIAASTATAHFNRLLSDMVHGTYSPIRPMAMFDARVFTIPDITEVENYFIWRQNDASRNSVQMAARAVFSHKECTDKTCPQLQDMLMEKNINWNNYTSGEKRGRLIIKQQIEMTNEYKGHQDGQATAPDTIIRNKWIALNGEVPYDLVGFPISMTMPNSFEIPIFTQDRAFLRKLIPQIPEANFGLAVTNE